MASRIATDGYRSAARADELVDRIAVAGRILDLPEARRRWLQPVVGELAPGVRTPEGVRIPQPDANRVLRGLIRFVADIDAGADLDLVWDDGHNELWVDAASIRLRCDPGLLTMQLTVGCDELPKPVTATVPFAVGRPDAPRGLIMSTVDRVDAPPIVAEVWSAAITAFCWEAVLELARRVSAESGRDRERRPLIPGGLAADDKALVIRPMARHDLGALEGRQ